MAPLSVYIKNMENKATTMEITTPLATYTIQEKVQTRTAYPETGGTTQVQYTQYNILKDDQLVGFVFNQDDVNQAIHDMETAAWKGVGCRFD